MEPSCSRLGVAIDFLHCSHKRPGMEDRMIPHPRLESEASWRIHPNALRNLRTSFGQNEVEFLHGQTCGRRGTQLHLSFNWFLSLWPNGWAEGSRVALCWLVKMLDVWKRAWMKNMMTLMTLHEKRGPHQIKVDSWTWSKGSWCASWYDLMLDHWSLCKKMSCWAHHVKETSLVRFLNQRWILLFNPGVGFKFQACFGLIPIFWGMTPLWTPLFLIWVTANHQLLQMLSHWSFHLLPCVDNCHWYC